MHTKFCTFFILFYFAQVLNAQTNGIEKQLNISINQNISYNAYDNASNAGFSFGISFKKTKNSLLLLQGLKCTYAEINYLNEWQLDDQYNQSVFFKTNLSLLNLEIPFAIGYKISKHLDFLAGASTLMNVNSLLFHEIQGSYGINDTQIRKKYNAYMPTGSNLIKKYSLNSWFMVEYHLINKLSLSYSFYFYPLSITNSNFISTIHYLDNRIGLNFKF